MRRPEPAELAWLAVLGFAAGVDVALLRRGHLPLSTVCRRSIVGRCIAVALVAHLTAEVPHDPLTALGRRMDRAERQRPA